jgi:hypothetical protein
MAGLQEDDDPWDPWFDKCFGFVVRAPTKRRARELANGAAGQENRGVFLFTKIADTTTPWLDPKYSSCIELTGAGEEGVIIEDVHSA